MSALQGASGALGAIGGGGGGGGYSASASIGASPLDQRTSNRISVGGQVLTFGGTVINPGSAENGGTDDGLANLDGFRYQNVVPGTSVPFSSYDTGNVALASYTGSSQPALWDTYNQGVGSGFKLSGLAVAALGVAALGVFLLYRYAGGR